MVTVLCCNSTSNSTVVVSVVVAVGLPPTFLPTLFVLGMLTSMPRSDCLILYERNIVGQTRHNVENERPLGVHCIRNMCGLQGDAIGISAGFNCAQNFKPYFQVFFVGGPEEGSPFPEP